MTSSSKPLEFLTLSVGEAAPSSGRNLVVLGYNNWDDWFEFETTFHVIYFDTDGALHVLGTAKIGQKGQTTRRPALPRQFGKLGDQFFSVGQDEDYYRDIHDTGRAKDIFTALRDMAYDLTIYTKAKSERVCKLSLFRSVDETRIATRFHRLSRGDVALSDYAFQYEFPDASAILNEKAPMLGFEVTPNSLPPTNVHVLIGRNGVGKTTSLNNMTRAFIDSDKVKTNDTDSGHGRFRITTTKGSSSFANLVSVTFSAFDPFFTDAQGNSERYAYVGLKQSIDLSKTASDTQTPAYTIKSPDDLVDDFVKSASNCLKGQKFKRWGNSLEKLSSDPIFAESNILELVDIFFDEDDWLEDARNTFKRLSSGHKIVLLTITTLVDLVQEQSLVLLDEPESHLHPPLLSAFIRSLSDLLTSQNGVAIIATHSPVVLQEVPKSCVWILDRSGHSIQAQRPCVETFGENVGQLTHEVFGLEVTETGFYEMIRSSIASGKTLDAVDKAFGAQLGTEARAVANVLSHQRKVSETL